MSTTPSVSNDVPDGIVRLLVQTRPWVRLIAVLAIVGLAFGAFAAALGAVARRQPVFAAMVPIGFSCLLYGPLGYWLWQSASAIDRLKSGGGTAALEEILRNQRSFWRYVGVLLVLAIGSVAAVVLVSFLSGFLRHRP